MTAKKPAKKKETRGRKTVWTPLLCQKIETGAAYDFNDSQLAEYAGISRETLYKKFREDPAFSDRIDSLRERPMLKAKESMVNALGDPNFALKYAERRAKKEFAIRTEHTGPEGAPLVITPVNYADLAEDTTDTP